MFSLFNRLASNRQQIKLEGSPETGSSKNTNPPIPCRFAPITGICSGWVKPRKKDQIHELNGTMLGSDSSVLLCTSLLGYGGGLLWSAVFLNLGPWEALTTNRRQLPFHVCAQILSFCEKIAREATLSCR